MYWNAGEASKKMKNVQHQLFIQEHAFINELHFSARDPSLNSTVRHSCSHCRLQGHSKLVPNQKRKQFMKLLKEKAVQFHPCKQSNHYSIDEQWICAALIHVYMTLYTTLTQNIENSLAIHIVKCAKTWQFDSHSCLPKISKRLKMSGRVPSRWHQYLWMHLVTVGHAAKQRPEEVATLLTKSKSEKLKLHFGKESAELLWELL